MRPLRASAVQAGGAGARAERGGAAHGHRRAEGRREGGGRQRAPGRRSGAAGAGTAGAGTADASAAAPSRRGRFIRNTGKGGTRACGNDPRPPRKGGNRQGRLQHAGERRGAWHGTARHGTARHGTARHGTPPWLAGRHGKTARIDGSGREGGGRIAMSGKVKTGTAGGGRGKRQQHRRQAALQGRCRRTHQGLRRVQAKILAGLRAGLEGVAFRDRRGRGSAA